MSWKVYDSNSTNIHQYDSPPSNLSHSAPSALFGHPAANVNDWYIVKEFSYLTGIPNGALNPAHGFPFHAPPNPPAYHSRGPSIIISACVTICLVLAITTLRLSLRYFRRDLRIGYDDFAIIPAALGVCVWLALQITMVGIAGDGKHMYDITYMNMSNFAKLASASEMTFFITVGLIKISITLFNRRLTGLTSRKWMIAHNIFLVLLGGYIISAIFVVIFTCRPFVGFGLINAGHLKAPQKCTNQNTSGTALSALHSAFDFALLTVPLITLYQLQMSLPKKIRLMFLFSVGSVSCIGAVMRQVIQNQADPDITWASRRIFAWTVVDLFFAVTAASLPVLNAAIPKGWRSPHSLKELRNISLLQLGSRQRSLEFTEFCRDGTVMDIEKDSFHRRTEQRWDDAFTRGINPKAPVYVHRPESSGESSSQGKSSWEGNTPSNASRHDAIEPVHGQP